jgi:hypothetical protein
MLGPQRRRRRYRGRETQYGKVTAALLQVYDRLWQVYDRLPDPVRRALRRAKRTLRRAKPGVAQAKQGVAEPKPGCSPAPVTAESMLGPTDQHRQPDPAGQSRLRPP